MIAEILFYLAIFLVLLALSAFFSGSETAYFSLSASDLEQLRASERHSRRRVAELMESPRQLLITIVLGNTIVNITTASIAALLTLRICRAFGFSESVGMTINVVIVTLVLLITSEILPKVIAVRSPRAYSSVTSATLKLLLILFYPVSLALSVLTRMLQNMTGISEDKMLLSEGELKDLVLMGEEHGTLEKDEKEMINSIFEFGETTVREIMVPRPDMVCVEINATLTELMEVIKSKVLSRIPVYRDRVDNIIGILYVKDLLPLLGKRRREKFNLEKLVRPSYFVPEQKKIDDLLREFKKERMHMALVVDEYGGISGLVTLEDVIEEIVGEIQDEYDAETPLFQRLDDHTFVIDGRMPLEEINEQLHLGLPTEEGVETISGFMLSLLGSLPKGKERAEYNGSIYIVERTEKNRILEVRVEKFNTDINISDEISG